MPCQAASFSAEVEVCAVKERCRRADRGELAVADETRFSGTAPPYFLYASAVHPEVSVLWRTGSCNDDAPGLTGCSQTLERMFRLCRAMRDGFRFGARVRHLLPDVAGMSTFVRHVFVWGVAGHARRKPTFSPAEELGPDLACTSEFYAFFYSRKSPSGDRILVIFSTRTSIWLMSHGAVGHERFYGAYA